jgi:hypothetical protein
MRYAAIQHAEQRHAEYIHGKEYTRLKMHFQCVFGVALHRTVRALDPAAAASDRSS